MQQTSSPLYLASFLEQVPHVAPETSVQEAIELLIASQSKSGGGCECALVVDGTHLVGSLISLDLLQYCLAHPTELRVAVREVMRTSVLTLKAKEVTPTLTLDLLAQRRATFCPVLDDQGYPLGVMTYRSLYRMLRMVEPEQDLVNELEDWRQVLVHSSCLETSNTLLATAVEYAGDGIEISNQQGVLEYVNPALEQMMGYTRSEMLGKTAEELFGTLRQDRMTWQAMMDALQNRQVWSGNLIVRRKDGVICHQEVTISPVCNGTGTMTHQVTVRRDVTDRKRIEEALRMTQFAVDQAADAVFWTRKDGRFIYVNRAACQLLGYSTPEFLMMSIQDIDLSFSAAPWEHYWQEIQAVGSMKLESHYLTREGRRLPVEITTNYLEFNGQVCHLAFVRDMSERKQVEAQLTVSLAEKDLLLKEVHHRVKNNLQVISSILSLQSHSISDPEMLAILMDSRNRIQSMALIHEKLYQTASLASIDFADYIRSLVQGLLPTDPISRDRISITFNLTEVCLGVDIAIPCGLLVNELVSNVLKHAFPDDRTGEIAIDFTPQVGNQFCLIVRDDGVGLPPDLSVERTGSLGFRLVRALVRQLRGTLEALEQRGTAFRITFPIT